MSDNIEVVEIERIREFEKRLLGYRTALDASQKKLRIIVEQVANSWRDPAFVRVAKMIETTQAELSAAKKVVDEDLLPFVMAKRKLLDEMQAER